jgi:Protein of unknown function (DUF2510)
MTSYGPPQQQQQQPTSGWYADPLGRHQLRYFDGSQWTEHVSSNGTTSVDPPVGQGHVPTVERAPEKVVRDVQRAGQGGVAGFQGGTGSIFTEPILVVNQKAKLIEINNEYAIYDQNAQQLAAVRGRGCPDCRCPTRTSRGPARAARRAPTGPARTWPRRCR